MFQKGSYPVIGRFNLGTADAMAADGTVRVRGIGVQIEPPDGQEWRMAMIDLPFFPVSTPQAFYELLVASAKKDDPDAMKDLCRRPPRDRRIRCLGQERALYGKLCGGAVQQSR